MKKLFAFWVLGIGLTSGAYAAIMGAPFLPEIDQRFNNLEQSIYSIPEAGNQGVFVDHHAKAIFNLTASGTYTSGITLPKNAIIQQAYWYISSSGTTHTSGTTLAFQCDAANDILSAVDISASGTDSITTGVETGSAATMHLVTTTGGCPVKAVVGVHDLAAAVIDLFLDYVIVK